KIFGAAMPKCRSAPDRVGRAIQATDTVVSASAPATLTCSVLCTMRASRARKPLGKENHGFAVHHRAVPLAHDLKIRGTLAERRTGLPAVGLQKIGRRGKHVGNAAPEIDVPVAVIVDAIFHV